MSATRISIDLMINAGILLSSRRMLIFGGPMIALGLTGKSVSTVKGGLMKPTRRKSVCDRNGDVLINVQSLRS